MMLFLDLIGIRPLNVNAIIRTSEMNITLEALDTITYLVIMKDCGDPSKQTDAAVLKD